MAEITLTFANPLNVSLQYNNDSANNYLGADIVYFQDASTQKVYKIGPCIDITNNTITCSTTDFALRPTANDFIFFAKNAEVNTSGIIGYHAVIDMEITSTDKKELYAVGSEVVLSS